MEKLEAIELAKKGSEKAYTSLYNKYYKLVHNNIFNIVKNKDVADDLTSETFLKIFKNMEKYSKDISFEMWIKTIANNHSIDFIRGTNKSKRDVYIDDIELSEFIYTDYSNPEKDFIKKEQIDILNDSLNGLKGKSKQILKLRYVDNLKYREIADEMKVDIGTVKNYIHKYKNKIIKNINQ